MDAPGRKRESGFWQQLRATIIRNVIRKKRNLKNTLTELIMPLYILVVVVGLQYAIPADYYPEVTKPEGTASLLKGAPLVTFPARTILVTPDDEETKAFFGDVLKSALALTNYQVQYLDSESEMEMMVANDSKKEIYSGVVFKEPPTKKLRYTLRYGTSGMPVNLPSANNLDASKMTCREKEGEGDSKNDNLLKTLYKLYEKTVPEEVITEAFRSSDEILPGAATNCPATTYYWSGFASLQAYIDQTWLKMKNPDHKSPELKVQLLPKRDYTGDTVAVVRSIIPLYIVLSLSQFIQPMVTVVVTEKEKKIKESMKMVGLRDSVFWLSWFIVYACLVSVISMVACLLIYFVILPNTNFAILLILILEFGLTIIMFAFMLTAMFSKAKTAGIFGGLATLLLSCFYYLQIFLASSPSIVFWFLSLLSPSAFAMGVDKLLVASLEYRPIDLWDKNDPTIPVGGIMLMLFLDIFIYGFLAAWLDNIIPTEYGTKRAPWFCFQPSYWLATTNTSSGGQHRNLTRQRSQQNGSSSSLETDSDIEAVPTSMLGSEAIVLNDLSKTFTPLLPFSKTPPVHAVQGVSLKMYPGEITAILGHNGAGKTTIFNMLTGMTNVTSGFADIFGYDITNANEMEEIRKMTGICPQHDVLFDELTPREHLMFFARIRGMTEDEIPSEVQTILEDIDLLDKADTEAENLSGGQKRKLSVGIALIGDPKIIFLDEPTAGVDPYSRRHMWSILKKRKEGKVILLTTHFMDEADILADRKAIISHGKVRCYGSSLFLKNKFGVGYHLTLVLEPNADISGLRHLIQTHIPEAEQTRVFGREVSFVLPRDAVKRFSSLFNSLESEVSASASSSAGLGVDSYGVSMTTLEEIFLRLGEEEEEAKAREEEEKERDQQQTLSNGAPAATSPDNQDTLTGYSFEAIPTTKSNWQIFKALAFVRVVEKYRDPGALAVQVIFPLLYVVIGIYLTSNSNVEPVVEKSLQLGQDTYQDKFRPPFTYQNHTDGPLTDYLSSLGSHAEHIDEGQKFADYLNQAQMAVLDFRVANSENLDLLSVVNFTSAHAIPSVVNAVSNMFVQIYDLKESIETFTHKFKSQDFEVAADFSSFGGAIFIGSCYCFMPLGLAVEILHDREQRIKNQLRVNGVSFTMYYLSLFTVLGSMMLFLGLFLLVIVQAFALKALILPPAFALLAMLYLMFIPSAIFFGATFSFLFKTVEHDQFLFNGGSMAGLLPYIIVSMLDLFKVADGQAGLIAHVVACFVSPLYIPFGVVYFINRFYAVSLCPFRGDCDQLTIGDYLENYEIYTMFIAIAFNTVVWFVLLRIVDLKDAGGKLSDLNPFSRKESSSNLNGSAFLAADGVVNGDHIENEDEDVAEERKRIAHAMSSPGPSGRVISLQGLRKEYKADEGAKGKKKAKKAKKVAVRNLSLGVEPGEVFGLLGHNGAGKTTTMRIVIAEEEATCGRVKVADQLITSNASRGLEMLGYCPQFDVAWKVITVREHLELFGAIRGVPPKEIKRLSQQFMDGLHISEHASKFSKNCSGGTKRKLSYAMAMLGDPKIVLMDEPSTGMDPQSKRFVWDTVMASFKTDRGAILTTHSMEEADALCTRVGIMVKGELRCIGSTQHLKNKYGAGYTLELKLRQPAPAAPAPPTPVEHEFALLESKLRESFPQFALNEAFADRRQYAIPQASVESLAGAFQALEKLKSEYSVEEYSFGQTTLEQVFIEFAKQQERADDADDGDNGGGGGGGGATRPASYGTVSSL